jgi:hypothetical protein
MLFPCPPLFILVTSLRQIALNTTVIVLDVNVHVIMVLFYVHHGCYLTKTCVTQCKIQKKCTRGPDKPLSRTCVLYCNRNKRKRYPIAQKLCILMQNVSLSLFFNFVYFILLQFVKFCFLSGFIFFFFS